MAASSSQPDRLPPLPGFPAQLDGRRISALMMNVVSGADPRPMIRRKIIRSAVGLEKLSVASNQTAHKFRHRLFRTTGSVLLLGSRSSPKGVGGAELTRMIPSTVLLNLDLLLELTTNPRQYCWHS